MPHKNSNRQSVIKDVQHRPEHVVVALTGEVDMHRSVEVRETLLGVLHEDKPALLVVNLAEVSFMDSSGLATLVEALQICRRKKINLKLVAVNQRVRAIFEIARLDTVFPMFETDAEALA